ncbi:MAG: hypothetical protein HYY24_17825 [Verrucomicrobia bacterium]|nr:hypothetical protein [Verrucomicrobiota bacterium]
MREIKQTNELNPMKTNHLFHSTRTRWATALLATVMAMALTLNTHAAGGTQSAGGKDIKVTITLDRVHTSLDRQTTGQGVNELRGDDPNATFVTYINGGKILAMVGRNRWISLDGNTSSRIRDGRTLYLDFANALGCALSGKVDNGLAALNGINDGICDPCADTTPLLPDSRFGALDNDDVAGFPDNFDFIIAGEDYDDLQTGCTVNTWARLMFTIENEPWFLVWGPYKSPGGANINSPDVSPVQVKRVSLSEWRFQTTGNHRAALYRSYANDGLGNREYHGQFDIKFSGTAVALPNQTLPPGNHCNVQVVPVDPVPCP